MSLSFTIEFIDRRLSALFLGFFLFVFEASVLEMNKERVIQRFQGGAKGRKRGVCVCVGGVFGLQYKNNQECSCESEYKK